MVTNRTPGEVRSFQNKIVAMFRKTLGDDEDG
jgi:hypothetical protein